MQSRDSNSYSNNSSNTTLRTTVTTAGTSVDSDAVYLELHQPHDQYQTYQHQQQSTDRSHPHMTFQDAQLPPHSPSSTLTEQQPRFNQQLYKQPRLSQGGKRSGSGNNNISNQQQQRLPLTVNPGLYRANVTAAAAAATAGSSGQVNNGSPYYQNPQFLSPVDSPQTPPPAYFLKKIELPEIDPVGDLVSEFECDLGSIWY